MNRGSDDFDTPTNPFRLPHWQTQVPAAPAASTAPAGPADRAAPTAPAALAAPTAPAAAPPHMPPARARRPWVLPTAVGATAVLLIAGATGGYLVYGVRVPAPALPAAATGSAPPPDPCAMVPDTEIERLVPAATVVRDSGRFGDGIFWSCDWTNSRLSYGEFWRSREVEVRLVQHQGRQNVTGRAMAQRAQENDLGFFTAKTTMKQRLKADEKQYYSKVVQLPDTGDGAFAQYTWSRSGTSLWYAFGEGRARVGDLTIEVRYQAGQRRKDAAVLTNESARAVTEANALREVGLLAGQLAKGVAAWRADRPDLPAAVGPAAATTSPGPAPSDPPATLGVLPGWCREVETAVAELVPEAKSRAVKGGTAGTAEEGCRWLNLEVPASAGRYRSRSVLVTAYTFTNRAGGADVGAAKGRFASDRGSAKAMASSSLGGYRWGKAADLRGLGEGAVGQYLADGKNIVRSGSYRVIARVGGQVFDIVYAGAERAVGAATNGPEVVLMPEREAAAGALKVAAAVLAAARPRLP